MKFEQEVGICVYACACKCECGVNSIWCSVIVTFNSSNTYVYYWTLGKYQG
jgi:hypothetical protein